MMGNGKKETEAQRNEFVAVRWDNRKRPHARKHTLYDQRVPALRSPVLLDAHLKEERMAYVISPGGGEMVVNKTEKD